MPHRNKKSGAKIALDTLINADWRIYILLAGILLINIGIVPLIEKEAFNTLRFIALKKFFVAPSIMAAVYLLTGALLILNLRQRRLAYIVPVGIFLLGYYIFTQVAITKAYTYGILTVGVSCTLMVAGFIRGGGFIVNKDINELQITDRETESIYIGEKAARAILMANDSNKEDIHGGHTNEAKAINK